VNTERAHLTCSSCGQVAEHELRYAGRLLHSTRCTACGHVVRHDQRDLYSAYLRDLEQRLVTKPRRLARRAVHEPGRFVTDLPRAILRQPVKLAGELWTLLRR
jgi:DNA-directed RNA polymerase subunit N (RpoN/RPB10)